MEKTSAEARTQFDPANPRPFFEDNGYFNIRQLEDGGWVANYRLLFTTAICVGLDAYGFERRYCYDDPDRAESEIQAMRRLDDEPTGWIARR